MNYMFSDILRLDPLQRSLIVAAIYMIPLQKRENYRMRMGISILACLFAAPLIRIYTRWSVQIFRYDLFEKAPYRFLQQISVRTTVDLLMYLIALTLVFYCCCKIRRRSAVYGAACAYLTQDLAYTIFVFFMPGYVHLSRETLNLEALAGKVAVMFVVYGIVYFIFARKIAMNGDYLFISASSLGIMLGVLTAGKILGSCARIRYDAQQSFYFNIILLYDLLLTFSLLIQQMVLRREEIYKVAAESEKNLREMQYHQYQIFRDNVASINHKCHDLKHMIAALRTEKDSISQSTRMSELEKLIMIYESQMNTGNKTLDAILTNTCMICDQKNIQWTCMADGKILNFIDAFDLYIMLGNALDNAIESLETVRDMENRFLVFNVWQRGMLVFIKIENYCEKEVRFCNGLPITTKSEIQEHGFGSQSIQEVAAKYHGEIKMYLEKNIFTLNIMIPLNIT